MKTEDVRKIIQEEIRNALREFNPELSDIIPNEPQRGYKIDSKYRSDKYLFTVDNTEEGRQRIERAKKALSDFFTFRIRGRHSNRKEVLGADYRPGRQNDIPIDKAQYLAVYVDAKS